jgi:hypothetical protein
MPLKFSESMMAHYIVHLKLGKLWKGGGGSGESFWRMLKIEMSQGEGIFFSKVFGCSNPPPLFPPPQNYWNGKNKKIVPKLIIICKGFTQQDLLHKFLIFLKHNCRLTQPDKPLAKSGQGFLTCAHPLDLNPGRFLVPGPQSGLHQ